MKLETYELFLNVEQKIISPEEAQKSFVSLLNKHEEKTTYWGNAMLECKLGIYEIFWEKGGSSMASIGQTSSGERWIAPVNWTCKDGGSPIGTLKSHLYDIDKIVHLY